MSTGTDYKLPPIQVLIGATPVDVTAKVRHIKTQRGRQHQLAKVEPGRLTLTMVGWDRTLDPTGNTISAQIHANSPVQVLCWWNTLSAAQAGGTLHWTTTNITSGWTGSNATLSFQPSQWFRLKANAAGAMSAQSSIVAAAPILTIGQHYTGVASFWAGNADTVSASTARSCSVTLSFYTSGGSFISSSAGTASNDGSTTSGGLPVATQVSVSAVAPSNTGIVTLTVSVAGAAINEIHSVTQPAIVPMNAAPSPAPPGGAVPLFTGLLDALDPQWVDNLNTTEQYTATDWLRVGRSDLITSTYQATVTTDGASNFWPFGDPVTQSTSMAADVIGTVPGNYVGGYTLGVQGPNFTDPTTAVSMSSVGGEVQIPNLIPSQVFGSWSMEVWFQTGNPPSTLTRVMRVLTAGMPLTVYGPEVNVHTDGSLALADASNTERVHATANYCNGVWHHVVVSVGTPSGSTATASLYVDGNLIGTYTGTSWFIGGTGTGLCFGAFELGAPFQDSLAYAAWYATTTLTGAQVLNHYNQGFTGYAVQDSGSRISSVLSALGALAPSSSVQTGYSQVMQPVGDLTTTSVTDYLQQVATAENGYLYMTPGGVLRFLNRYAPLTAPRNVSLSTFGENAGETPYLKRPDVGVDVTDLKNRSLVSRQTGELFIQGVAVGGTASVPQVAQDTGSQSTYQMAATLSETGLLVTTDAECLARAQWNVGLYAQPLPRVRSLTVDPLADRLTRLPTVLYRDLFDRVTFKRRPWDSASNSFGSPVFTQDEYIEQVSHDIDLTSGMKWRTTYAMWPALTQTLWILGDPVLGVLGSTTRLGY